MHLFIFFSPFCFFFFDFQACRDGLIDIVRALLQGSAPTINTLDKEGLAPLHYAARYDRAEIVQLLIEGGAGTCNIDPGVCRTHSSLVITTQIKIYLILKTNTIRVILFEDSKRNFARNVL